jgi:hypothetical protein
MLLKKELIKEIPLVIKKGKVMLLELTILGRNILLNIKGNSIERKRMGGAIHEFWKVHISNFYRSRGFKVHEEKPVNGGRTADLCIENNGQKIAIEIETGKSDALWNIRKDLAAGFDEVISVAVDDNVYEDLRLKLLNINWPTKIRLTKAESFY